MCKATNSFGSSEVNYTVHVLGKFFSYTLTKIMYNVIIIMQEWQTHSHLMRYRQFYGPFLNTEVVPPQVLALCSIVVWYTPAVTSAVDIMITGYDVMFYSPQSDMENVIRHVGANQTFYIVQNEDKTVANLEDIYVQVIRSTHKINVIHKSTPVLLHSFVQIRVIHDHRTTGEWSDGINLGELTMLS